MTNVQVSEAIVIDKDLPAVPRGSLGSFKRGLQSIPLQVSKKALLLILLLTQINRENAVSFQVKRILGNKCKVAHSLQTVKPHNGGWLSTFCDKSSGESKVRQNWHWCCLDLRS